MAGSELICPKDATEGLGAQNLSGVTMEQIINMFNSYISNSEALQEEFNTFIVNTNFSQLLDVNDLIDNAPIGSFAVMGADGLWTYLSSDFTLHPSTYTTLGGVIIGNGLNVDINGLLSLDYNLPIATTSTIGGVIIGSGLTVGSNGLISTNIPIATTSSLGTIIVGDGLQINSQGILTTIVQSGYTLPVSTSSILGGVKIGLNINVSSDGTISVSFPESYVLPIASNVSLGGVKIGSGIITSGDGTISVSPTSLNSNILSWSNNSYTAYASKKLSDPGYSYFYSQSINPTFSNNTLYLDGNLSTTGYSAFSSDGASYGYLVGSLIKIGSISGGNSSYASIQINGSNVSFYAANTTLNKSSIISIGDNQSSYNGEYIVIDDNDRKLDLHFTNINLSKGMAGKWLSLDSNKNIVFNDAPNTSYTPPSYPILSPNLTGAHVLGALYVDALGNVSTATSRTLTLADLGYVAPDGNFIYSINSSNINSIPVFDAITGNIVRDTSAMIDIYGQMTLSSTGTYSLDASGSVNAIRGHSTASDGIGITAQSPYIPLYALSLDNITPGILNCLTIDTDSSSIVSVVNGFGTSIDWAGSNNRGTGSSIIMHRELVSYIGSSSNIENTGKEWWLLNNGILTKVMWVDNDGNLYITGSLSSTGGSILEIDTDDNNILGGPITSSGTISHNMTDGHLHVPQTGYINYGNVLMAGPTPGSASWQPLDKNAGGNHQQVYSIGVNSGAGIESQMLDMSVNFTPKSNYILILFTSTVRVAALAQTVRHYINRDGSRLKTYEQDVYQDSNVTSFNHLEQVTPATPTTVTISWNASTATESSYRNLIIVDLPVNVASILSGGTVVEIDTSGAITGGSITTSGTIGHRSDDGYLHVPVNPGGTCNGKFLMAGSTSGAISWETVSGGSSINYPSNIGLVTSNGSTSSWGSTIVGSATGQLLWYNGINWVGSASGALNYSESAGIGKITLDTIQSIGGVNVQSQFIGGNAGIQVCGIAHWRSALYRSATYPYLYPDITGIEGTSGKKLLLGRSQYVTDIVLGDGTGPTIGGTGIGNAYVKFPSYTSGALIVTNSDSGLIKSIGNGAINQVLTSNGVSSDPSWQTLPSVGPIGSGTAGRLPIWLTGGSTIGNSIITSNGSDLILVSSNGYLSSLNIWIGNGGSFCTISSGIAMNNTAVGNYAGYSNTTGYNNSFFGYAAGYANTTGYNNSYVGWYSGYQNTTGYNNVAIGYNAGSSFAGSIALVNATTSIFIGTNSQALADNGSNEIVIGSNIVGKGSNTTSIGNLSTLKTFMGGALVLQVFSTAQKNAIASPTPGTIVYDYTLNKLCVFTTSWQTITSV